MGFAAIITKSKREGRCVRGVAMSKKKGEVIRFQREQVHFVHHMEYSLKEEKEQSKIGRQEPQG